MSGHGEVTLPNMDGQPDDAHLQTATKNWIKEPHPESFGAGGVTVANGAGEGGRLW